MKSEKELPSLSVAIISRYEEARFARCLESVRAIAREIIADDFGLTDATIAIAEAMGANKQDQKTSLMQIISTTFFAGTSI
jgi:glycosyltransferase involved in cell wall biosynthesis